MFKKLDHDFLEILEEPAKLEKRLTDLASQRFSFTITATMAALVFFITLFILLGTNIRSLDLPKHPSISIAPPVSGCLIMLTMLTVMLARAIGAHSEIRTLLTFKKLRDLREIESSSTIHAKSSAV